MTKPPLLASESARASVIAVVMLLLLAASLGLAYGLVVLPGPARHELVPGEPQRVGDLMINVPDGWRSTDLGQGFEKFQVARRFTDRRNATRQMIVGLLVSDRPAAPLHVMYYLLATMLGRASPQSILAGPAIRELQVGTMIGLRYTDAVETSQGVQERFMAVMTADGRRQWVIIVSQLVETPAQLQQRIKADDQGFERICDSASLPKAPQAPAVGTPGKVPEAGAGATTKKNEETP